MIPREPIELAPAFADPARVHALFDSLAPYPMLQARAQVMGSHLEQAAITGDGIDLHLLGVLEVLGDHDWVVLGHLRRPPQAVVQVVLFQDCPIFWT